MIKSHTLSHASAWRIAALVILFAVAATLLAIALYRSPSAEHDDDFSGSTALPAEIPYHAPSNAGYIGSAACAECHREIAETYRLHPMANSTRTVASDAAALIEQNRNLRVECTQKLYEVTIDGTSLVHHEQIFDAEGELIYDLPVPMDYVVGSGQRAKAYLHQHGDLLFMSPLNWYSQARTWDLAPGFTRDDPRRFDRRITEECLSCHAGRVSATTRGSDRFAEAPFPEASIGCESCHGPGEQHVQRHALRGTLEIEESIVNPGKLAPELRESVCYQCHLQATARIPRPGRSDLDFRPGESIDEIWSVLDVERGISDDGRTHSVNHVQQMRESRCFTESQGRFGCISCHDPHRVPSAAEALSFYQQRCLTCHTGSSCTETSQRRQAANDSCIVCHMPTRHSTNISHITQTDHRVRRQAVDLGDEAKPAEGDTLGFFNQQDQRLSPWERERALALAAWKHLSKKGQRPPFELGRFLDQISRVHPDDSLILVALGTLAIDLGEPERAKGYYLRALAFPDKEEAALMALVELFYNSRDWTNTLTTADRLIEINPRLAMPFALRADTLKMLGRLREGVESAQRALELNPSLIPVRRWLVDASQELGDMAESERQQKLIERLEGARVSPASK